MAADDPVLARALDYLRREQEPDGSWFGRWGTNYIYGTWSVLCALNAAGVRAGRSGDAPRGRGFSRATQRDDGGWGEDNETYADGAARRAITAAPRRRPRGRCWG